MLLAPSDHVIDDVAAFHDAIKIAAAAAESGNLVTFGITPMHAETGYGYIQVPHRLRELMARSRGRAICREARARHRGSAAPGRQLFLEFGNVSVFSRGVA